MKNIVIFGNSDFARLLKYYIDIDDIRDVVAFTVERTFIVSDEFCEKPVVAFEDVEKQFPPNQYEMLIAIGNKNMNRLREKIFYTAKKKGYTIASYIHSSSIVHCKEMGEGNILLEKCLIYPFTRIGNGNLFWDNVMIAHDCTVQNFNTFAAYTDLCGYVKIGNNGFYGKNCVIKEYIEVADYTLVGATAYVDKNTNPFDVVVPARSVVLKNKKSTDLM